MSKASKLVWVIEVANYGSKFWRPLTPLMAKRVGVSTSQSRGLPMAVFRTRDVAYLNTPKLRAMDMKTRVRQARVTMEVLPR